MAQSLWQVRDELWQTIEPLLPRTEPDPRGGRPRIDDRVAFGAIVFVLFTGIAWRHLPRELGCSPATAHRRLGEWQRHGVFGALHHELLRRLNRAGGNGLAGIGGRGRPNRGPPRGPDRGLGGWPVPERPPG